jgi:hypothetical protein
LCSRPTTSNLGGSHEDRTGWGDPKAPSAGSLGVELLTDSIVDQREPLAVDLSLRVRLKVIQQQRKRAHPGEFLLGVVPPHANFGRCHVWMAPADQGLFRRCAGRGCGHVFGLWRGELSPPALMLSADPLPRSRERAWLRRQCRGLHPPRSRFCSPLPEWWRYVG